MCNSQTYLSSNNTFAKLQKQFDWMLLSQKKDRKFTIDSKIIRALEVIRVKLLMPNAIL